jgi:predicted phage replisome organizer
VSGKTSPKKYFWLKLKEDFFTCKEIKKLRKVSGGDTFVIIYLKMQLLSIKQEGYLKFDGIEDSFAEEIALTLDENEENVKMTLAFLFNYNLIEKITEDDYYMTRVSETIGKESESAERVRRHREKAKLIENNVNKTLLGNATVTQSNICVTTCNTEIEKEKEIYIEKELELKKSNERKTKTKVFVIPTIDEIKEYIKEIKSNIDADNFFDYYTSNGWMVGKQKMKDWKATVRRWSKNNFSNNNKIEKESYNNNDFADVDTSEDLISWLDKEGWFDNPDNLKDIPF